MENKNRPKCKYCKSKFGYVKIEDKEFQCRTCGKITPLEEALENGSK